MGYSSELKSYCQVKSIAANVLCANKGEFKAKFQESILHFRHFNTDLLLSPLG